MKLVKQDGIERQAIENENWKLRPRAWVPKTGEAIAYELTGPEVPETTPLTLSFRDGDNVVKLRHWFEANLWYKVKEY